MSDKRAKRFKQQAGCGSKNALRRARGRNQHNGKKSSAGTKENPKEFRQRGGAGFRRVRKEER